MRDITPMHLAILIDILLCAHFRSNAHRHIRWET